MVTTTSSTSETFNFAYALQGNGVDGFKLQDNDPSTKKPIDPIAGTVTVVDPNGGSISAGQQIQVASGGGNLQPWVTTGNDYVFVAQASVKDHGHKLSGIVIENTTTGNYVLLTEQQYTGKAEGKNGDVTLTTYQDTICFMAGTMVRTPDGEVAVETLRRGDLVLTHDGRS